MGTTAPSQAREVQAEPPAGFEPMTEGNVRARILVVEDEHLVALDIKLRLERMGHSAVVAYSGESALQRAKEEAFDLALMDIKLKGVLDGIETATRLREEADLPIIYLTAYADKHTLDRARVTEPYGYVLKPFQERELRAAIEMTLQRHGNDQARNEQQQLQRFLADASAKLAATLDFEALARDAVELLVPRYADWCAIRLEETSDRQVPEFTCTYPPTSAVATNGHGPGRLVQNTQRTGQPQIVTQLGDPTSLIESLGVEYLETLQQIGARSALCVPLRAREQLLGTLAMVSGQGRARYSDRDLYFAEDFAYRLAMALDNALLYRAAERAIRMRDDVLAVVSHDLRTPLGSILLQGEVLTTRPELGGVGASIMRSAQRMNRLIGDLLDASAINAGHLALDVRRQSVAEIAHEAVEMFRSQAEDRSITLTEELPDEDVQIECDRDRIIQVLSNLIGNALKFTRRGGSVTLRVLRSKRRVTFEVQDTGQGIEPEQVPYLFDRFWRGQSRKSGVGLGLFIARGIMAAHGGTLEVDTKVGVGSRFYFSLPLAVS